jgi:hypothetical protein
MNVINREESKWIWKDEKEEYKNFLTTLELAQKRKILEHETLKESSVFTQVLTATVEETSINFSWDDAYRAFIWFEIIYRIWTENSCYSISLKSEEFAHVMKYRVKNEILWKYHRSLYLSCISESKILEMLRAAHDERDHWRKQATLTKIRELVYWSSQSTDVKKYIRECIQCALHDSAIKSQLLQSVRVQRSFQLIEFDFIESLSTIKRESIYIFHVIDYLTRFFMTFSIKTTNAEDVIKSLNQVFFKYVKSSIIYYDREQHFKNFKVKSFLNVLEISIEFSSSDASQSIEMIEVENKLLKNILRKSQIENWEIILSKVIYNLNARTIHHLDSSSASILMSVFSNISMIDSFLRDKSIVNSLMTDVLNFVKHKKIMYEFLNFRSQLHDIIRIRSNRQKNKEKVRFNKEIAHYQFFMNDFVFLYQKRSNKLESRWRESFRINEYEDNHDISYTLRQLNEKKINDIFHENHLKSFLSRIDYLIDSIDISLSSEQIIRKFKRLKRTKQT